MNPSWTTNYGWRNRGNLKHPNCYSKQKNFKAGFIPIHFIIRARDRIFWEPSTYGKELRGLSSPTEDLIPVPHLTFSLYRSKRERFSAASGALLIWSLCHFKSFFPLQPIMTMHWHPPSVTEVVFRPLCCFHWFWMWKERQHMGRSKSEICSTGKEATVVQNVIAHCFTECWHRPEWQLLQQLSILRGKK